jgi:2-dehydro-3-deoxyphosphogluconate aldolase / (4S)-4-hydroxy-2-oxoglutarate aldolase
LILKDFQNQPRPSLTGQKINTYTNPPYMARFERYEVIARIRHQGMVPVFYNADMQVCHDIIKVCYGSGLRSFEFTNRGDFAHEVFAELLKYANNEYPDMMLGVGSVIDEPTTALYLQLGANFVVSPLLDKGSALICNKRKVLWIPGCGSVSEISEAEALGADIVKIFPAASLGPGFVKAIKGPMPWVSIMPTSGVDATEDSIRAWFEAGVVAVGLGSQLFTKELLESRNFTELSTRISKVLDWISKYKKS